MARPQTLTLAELEARHAVETDKCRAGAMRGQARALARALGTSIPTWAAKQANPFVGRPVREHAPRPDAKPVSTYLPSELREWRRRTPGSVIQIGQLGIVLHTTDHKHVFVDMSSAVAFAISQ